MRLIFHNPEPPGNLLCFFLGKWSSGNFILLCRSTKITCLTYDHMVIVTEILLCIVIKSREMKKTNNFSNYVNRNCALPILIRLLCRQRVLQLLPSCMLILCVSVWCREIVINIIHILA